MNGFALFNGTSSYLEIRQRALEVLDGERGLELPLERAAGGRLTDACKQNLVAKLQDFFKRPPWQARPRVHCAIGARGVSLRRLTIPVTTRENLERVLLLQVEAEFPVPPDELAWGYRLLASNGKNGSATDKQDVLIAAIRKEAVQEYADLLAKCGVTPVFTLAALARSRLCPQPPTAYAILDIGRNNSEVVFFDNDVPSALRILPWGGDTITRALAERLNLAASEAEAFKLKLESAPRPNGEIGPKIESALESALDALAAALNGSHVGRKIYLTGKSIRQKDLAARLARRLGPGAECHPVEVTGGAGRTAAVLGLRQLNFKGEAPFILEAKATHARDVAARPIPWKWAGVSAALALALVLLPYGEAFFLRGHLMHKLSVLKRDTARLATIDQELNFLEYVKQGQPPYLDTLFLFAKASPPGARLDSLTMNRKGELSWRATLKDSQQVADFRSKLIDSGMFANVTVEEQGPATDRQKLAVRMSAQWRALSPRQMLALGPTPEEIERARTNVHQLVFGAPPMFPGGFPGGAMPGPPPGAAMLSRRAVRPMPVPGSGGPAIQMAPGTPVPVPPGGPNPAPMPVPPEGVNP
jgi:Tfp pilus assembly PilM family ATPase